MSLPSILSQRRATFNTVLRVRRCFQFVAISDKRILTSSVFEHPPLRPSSLSAPLAYRFSSTKGDPSLNANDFGFFNAFSTTEEDNNLSSEPNEEEMKKTKEVERLRKIDEQREFCKTKKGRGWTDPWDLEPLLESQTDVKSLPDWAPELVSRISQERVRIYQSPEGKRTIPTLLEMSTLPLPLPSPPNPELHMKAYALYRKRFITNYIRKCVEEIAEPKIANILKMSDWNQKQDAIDVLFEQVEFALRDNEPILGKQPQFGMWVEKALEAYLRSIQKKIRDESGNDASTSAGVSTAGASPSNPTPQVSSEEEQRLKDEFAVPLFMDCYNASAGDTEDNPVPKILFPMKGSVPLHPVMGRMIEEWELSAHKATRRILLRQCTRSIARALVQAESAPRIVVHGSRGVGKTAAVAAIVAAARTSGAIVLFLPEGDQFHQNGFYIEPNDKRSGVFDLPILTQGVCRDLVDLHSKDLEGFEADAMVLETYFTDGQLGRIKDYVKGTSMSLLTLLNHGVERVELASMCYSAAVHVLMRQDQKAFIMVLDEANCFFMPGQYFHEKYDEDVKKPIPYHEISLFEPILTAFGVTAMRGDEDHYTSCRPPVMMKRGAVILAMTESHAVSRIVSDTLLTNAKSETDNKTGGVSMHVIEVPRLSTVEVQHVLSNYEATGVGSLRLDRGATVMNHQEVAYLQMASGGIPLHLMNAVMV
jgi:Mitochondrial ribosomal death-associated protein 3